MILVVVAKAILEDWTGVDGIVSPQYVVAAVHHKSGKTSEPIEIAGASQRFTATVFGCKGRKHEIFAPFSGSPLCRRLLIRIDVLPVPFFQEVVAVRRHLVVVSAEESWILEDSSKWAFVETKGLT